jgi:chromosome partitioning related protein ParA
VIVIVILSTKGGVGKTTVAANLGAIVADAGNRVLLLDMDTQPTLSSYFTIRDRAPGGVYELMANNEDRHERIISRTSIRNLDLVISNDPHGQLSTLLLHVPDGRLRLRNLLSSFSSQFDVMIIDTQGARSVLLETAVLAASVAVSPVIPQVLAARELHRGTIQLLKDLAPYRTLGIEPPALKLLINNCPTISSNARVINQTLRQMYQASVGTEVLTTQIPAIEAYPRAAAMALPVHRLEHRKPRGRIAPSALDTMKSLAIELLPEMREQLSKVTGAAPGERRRHG